MFIVGRQVGIQLAFFEQARVLKFIEGVIESPALLNVDRIAEYEAKDEDSAGTGLVWGAGPCGQWDAVFASDLWGRASYYYDRSSGELGAYFTSTDVVTHPACNGGFWFGGPIDCALECTVAGEWWDVQPCQ